MRVLFQVLLELFPSPTMGEMLEFSVLLREIF